MSEFDEWRFRAVERRLQILEREMKQVLRDLAVLSGITENKLEARGDTKALWGWVAAVASAMLAAAVAWFRK